MYIYNIIEQIRPRPGMYLGERSITRLRSFLDGYQSALSDLGIREVSEDTLLPLPLQCFHDYVALRFDYYESTSGWCNMILDQTAHDEEKGLQLFFALFDDFKRLKTTRFLAADLTDENKAHHLYDKYAPRCYTGPNYDKAEPVYHDPLRIFYAELTDPSAYKGYMSIVQTEQKYIIERSIYKTEEKLLSYYEKCFGAVSWQPLDHNPLEG